LIVIALRNLIESKSFEAVLTGLIVVNAITLGLETSPAILANWGPWLHTIDRMLLGVFVIELLVKLVVYRLSFFKSGWNVFDFAIIAIALVPASGPLTVLRALRILRVLRLVTIIPSLKRVVGAMIASLPGMGSIILLLLLVFYVGGVMSTKLFQVTEPEAFGTLGRSLYTLFQLMTLDGWSGEIVKPVLKNHPYAMLFFLPFILFSAFVALNLFIGVIVGAMQSEAEEAAKAAATDLKQVTLDDDRALLAEIRGLRAEIQDMKQTLPQRD
jgi:voltage-gated sodium channel